MPEKTIARSDVDGTVPGVAMLVMANLSDPDTKVLHETITEAVTADAGAAFPNPHQSCERLWESTKGDWPGYSMTVMLNERARYLMTKGRMESIGVAEYTVDQYLQD